MTVGTKKNKCNSRPFWLNPTTGQTFLPGSVSLLQRRTLQYWDSQLEYQVYNQLCKSFHPSQIKRQHRFYILPKTDIFPALTWDIDFAILTPTQTHFIEAKGKWICSDKGAMGDFCKMLRFFEQTSPLYFSRLQIISDSKWKIGTTNLYTIPVRQCTFSQ